MFTDGNAAYDNMDNYDHEAVSHSARDRRECSHVGVMTVWAEPGVVGSTGVQDRSGRWG